MKLEIRQLARMHEVIDFQVSLIAETEDEKSKFPKDSENIQTDRFVKAISISPDLLGKSIHGDSISQAIQEVYKEWELIK